MKTLQQLAIIFLISVIYVTKHQQLYAQDCSPEVPVFNVDLTSDPNGVWLSPFVVRDGNCCGTQSPDRCVAFIITLHENAEGIIFDVCDGAVSPGAMFYQVDCGPQIQVGQAICLDGEGPHYLTFCKPGNNNNVYCITSVSEPSVSPGQVVGDGCSAQLSVWGFEPSTIEWNSISPMAPGTYNSFLNCLNCENVIASAEVLTPLTVVYEICGLPLGGCEINLTCVQVEVTFVPGLQLSIMPQNPVVCYGENSTTVEVQIEGGMEPFEIIWSDGSTGTSANLPAGNAWVSVNDATDCPVVSYNFQVTQITQQPSVFAGADIILCSGTEQVNIQGQYSNADGAFWTGGNGSFLYDLNQLNNIYVPTPQEIEQGFILSLTTIDNNGCPIYSDEIDVSLGLVDFTNFALIDSISCFGYSDGAIQLNSSGLSQPFSYLWNNGSQEVNIDNLQPGDYSVIITDSFGCDTTLFFELNAPPQPAVFAGNDLVICSGIDAVQIQGFYSDADGAYWSGAEGNFEYPVQQVNNIYYPSQNEIQNGFTLVLQTTSLNNCPAISDEIEISLGFVNLEVQANITDIDCNNNNNGSINLIVSGDSGPFNYLWNNNSQNNTVENLSEGIYEVTIEDNAGCDTTFYFTITNPLPLQMQSLLIEDVSCFGLNNGQVSVTATGGVPPLNAYLFNSQLEYVGFQVEGVAPGNYNVVVEDANGCQILEEISINQPAPLVASFTGDDIICPGESVPLVVEASGGSGQISFQWNQGLTGQSQHLVSPQVTTNYSVVVSDEEGCEVGPLTQTVQVMVLTLAGLSMSENQNICPGEPATVSAQFYGNYGPYSYQWSNGLGFQPGTFNVIPESDTWYSFTVYDVCGNTLQDSVLVHLYEVPEFDLPGMITQSCIPLEVDFSDYIVDYPGATYNWSFGDGYFSTSSNPVHEYNSPGIFHASVLLTTSDGCTLESQSSGTVLAFNNPEIEILTEYTTTSLDNPDFILTAGSNSDNIEFRWFEQMDEYSIGNSLELSYSDTGTYVITLVGINEYGCSDQQMITLQVIPVHNLIIPNVFTPDPDSESSGFYNNNSLNNDIFFPFTEYVKEFEMLIFNRWGEIVFASNDISFGWNGYYRGEPCQQDVYVYKIKVEYTDGIIESRIGDITLLR